MKMKKTNLIIAGLVCALTLPEISYAQKVIGRFSVVRGKVFVKNSKGKSKKARFGAKVKEGDIIGAAKKAKAKVVLLDKNEIEIQPGTTMKFSKYKQEIAGREETLIDQFYGKVRHNVAEKYDGKNKKYNVRTVTAVAGVRGTQLVKESTSEDESLGEKIFYGVFGDFEEADFEGGDERGLAQYDGGGWENVDLSGDLNADTLGDMVDKIDDQKNQQQTGGYTGGGGDVKDLEGAKQKGEQKSKTGVVTGKIKTAKLPEGDGGGDLGNYLDSNGQDVNKGQQSETDWNGNTTIGNIPQSDMQQYTQNRVQETKEEKKKIEQKTSNVEKNMTEGGGSDVADVDGNSGEDYGTEIDQNDAGVSKFDTLSENLEKQPINKNGKADAGEPEADAQTTPDNNDPTVSNIISDTTANLIINIGLQD